MEELQPWKQIVDEQGNRLVAFSNVYLKKSDCTVGECNIGSLVTDSYVHAVSVEVRSCGFIYLTVEFAPQWVGAAEPGSWTYASMAITNSGGIRTDLTKGCKSEWF